MKILSESKTNANDQVTEQDETAQKDSEESQVGILQSIKKLLSKQSPSDDSQTVQDSSVDKKDGEDSEKATLQAIAKILGQKSTNEKSNKKDKKPVPGGNTTEDGQLLNGTKGKNTSTKPKGKGTTMASQVSQFKFPTHNGLYFPPGDFPNTLRKLDLDPALTVPSRRTPTSPRKAKGRTSTSTTSVALATLARRTRRSFSRASPSLKPSARASSLNTATPLRRTASTMFT